VGQSGRATGDISERVLLFSFLLGNAVLVGLSGLLLYSLKQSVRSCIVLGIMFSVYFDFVIIRHYRRKR